MSAEPRMSAEKTYENAMTDAGIRPANAEVLSVTLERFFSTAA